MTTVQIISAILLINIKTYELNTVPQTEEFHFNSYTLQLNLLI